MSLKRKASFPTIASPQRTEDIIDRPLLMDESPKHLHSRTRKRVRNGRPDDQTVYENTLRWLFTAQQREQQIPTPPTNQDENMEPEPSAPLADPRQQTLLRFFRPVQSSHPPCPSSPMSHISNDSSQASTEFLQCHDIHVSPLTARDSGKPAHHTAGHNMDMDLDMDWRSDESLEKPKRWLGSIGWM